MLLFIFFLILAGAFYLDQSSGFAPGHLWHVQQHFASALLAGSCRTRNSETSVVGLLSASLTGNSSRCR